MFALTLVQAQVVFDFTNPKGLTYSPALSATELSDMEGQGAVVNLRRYTEISNSQGHAIVKSPVTISFTDDGTGATSQGAFIYHYKASDGADAFWLELRDNTKMTVSVGSGYSISKIEIVGTLGNIKTFDSGTHTVDKSAYLITWTPSMSGTSSVTLTQGSGTETQIQKIYVYTNAPAAPLLLSSVSPAAKSDGTVDPFNSIVLTYSSAVTVVSNEGITISGPGINGAETLTATASGNTVTLTSANNTTFNSETADYTLTVPAGAFRSNEGSVNSALSRTFSVKVNRATLKDYSVDPSTDATYSALPETITLNFDVYLASSLTSTADVTFKNGSNGFKGSLAVGADKKSVIITHPSYTNVTDEGTWTVTIAEKSFTNGLEDAWNPQIVLNYTVESQEAAELREAKRVNALSGIGYPSATSAVRTDLAAAIAAAEAAGAAITTEQITALSDAIAAFYASTEVNMPEDGTYYTIAGVNAAGGMSYLYYINGGITLRQGVTNENGYKFKAVKNDDGTFTFETQDGAYLSVLSTESGSPSNGKSVSSSNKAKLLSLGKVGVTLTEANKEALLGKLQMNGWRGRDNDDQDLGYGFSTVNGTTIVNGKTEPVFTNSETSAFAFTATSEWINEVNQVTPAAELQPMTLANAGDEMILRFTNSELLKVAIAEGGAAVSFVENNPDGKTVSFSGTILSSTDRNNDLSVNTSGMAAGNYSLVIPVGALTYTLTDEAIAAGKVISEVRIVKDFTITSGGSGGGGGDSTEPVTPTTPGTPVATLSSTSVTQGSPLILTISNVTVASAVTTRPYFVQQGTSTNAGNATLTAVGTDKKTWSVNTTALSAGSYTLIVPTGTFTYTGTVTDKEFRLNFTITSSQTVVGNVEYIEGFGYLGSPYPLTSGDIYWADYELNTFVIWRPKGWGGLVANPSKKVTFGFYYNSSVIIRSGHFENYPTFAQDNPKFVAQRIAYDPDNVNVEYDALRFVLDAGQQPLKQGELTGKEGKYSYYWEAGAYGDDNYGIALNGGTPSATPQATAWMHYDYNVDNSRATSTDIRDQILEQAAKKKKVYYDLQGRRVDNPTKGLYIVNGRKVFVK